MQHLSDTNKRETEKMIRAKLELYNSDKTGLTDFASEIIGNNLRCSYYVIKIIILNFVKSVRIIYCRLELYFLCVTEYQH